MESPSHSAEQQSTGAKRKRTPIAESAPAPPALHQPSTNVPQINYLAKARPEKLRVIEGDAETFADVLGMIDDYEGVLQRHESLASNMGAKLVGPLLLKSFEKLFDGPIKIVQGSFALEQSSVSWIDIVSFARTNPSDFVLTDAGPGLKACRIWIKGGQIEISEDDYRLIVSGAPERMVPTQPIAEDESAELATLNILETRLAILIKKADAVASKARQLNYHLKGRKSAIIARKATDQSKPESSERTFSPQPFSAVNSRSPAPPANGELVKIQQQLLEQFLTTPPPSSSRRTSIAQSRPKTTRIANSSADSAVNSTVITPTGPASFHPFVANASAHDLNDRHQSHPVTASSSDDGAENHHRVLMATKVDKLAKGDIIFPPCDRCRRLKFDCTKHLTACTACTKKHAKCAWKDIREGELEFSLRPQAPQPQPPLPQLQENGAYMSIETTGQLSPGQRSPLSGSGPQMSAEDERMYRDAHRDRDREQRSFAHGMGLSPEQVLLTQIASAAAAAGNRS